MLLGMCKARCTSSFVTNAACARTWKKKVSRLHEVFGRQDKFAQLLHEFEGLVSQVNNFECNLQVKV